MSIKLADSAIAAAPQDLPLSGEALLPLFQHVAAILQRYQTYWQFSPMNCQVLPWQSELTTKLQQLDLTVLAALEQDSEAQLQQFSAFFPELNTLPFFRHAEPATAEWPFWLTNGINGRKLEQIKQFSQFVPDTSLPVLEWCAGKGHLGRLLAAQRACTVTSVEWQAQLCTEGQQLAQHFKLAQQFVQADVLSEQAATLLQPKQQALALHACGQLHIRLLQLAAQAHCQQVQIAPCCYHLIGTEYYQPLSQAAAASGLVLSRQDLKLAVQAQVTGGERIRRLRQTEVAWRLAYDELQRYYRNNNTYQPLPSTPKHWFSGDFANFARFAADTQQLTLPSQVDWQAFLNAGEQRYLLVQRLDAIRHLFRRPLELYLVLDRALYLQEQGYQTSVQAFCDYSLTPRNLLIRAQCSHPLNVTLLESFTR